MTPVSDKDLVESQQAGAAIKDRFNHGALFHRHIPGHAGRQGLAEMVEGNPGENSVIEIR